MGADWYARTVIGCEVIVPDIVTMICDRVTPVEGDRFCGKCAAHAHNGPRIRTEPGETPDEIGEFKVTYTTDQRRVFVGVVLSTDYKSDAVMHTPQAYLNDSLKEDLRRTLEPLNMWNPETFGLWTVLYCSY